MSKNRNIDQNPLWKVLQSMQTFDPKAETFDVLNHLLPLEYLKMHTHIVAPSGCGKTELMRLLFWWMQHQNPDSTLILIDPHGSMAKDCKYLKYNNAEVVYIDPTFKDGYSPGFNVFDLGTNLNRKNLTQTCEQIFTAFLEVVTKDEGKKISALMVNALEKSIYFILQKPDTSIIDLLDLLNADIDLVEEAYEYDHFFNATWKDPSNKTRIALYNRFSRLMNSPILRDFLSNKNSIDLEAAMNEGGKVILIDIGDVGEGTQELIGKLYVATIKSLIRKRRKNTGKPVFFFIDEVHILMSGSFEYILSQLRGYGLHLVFAHQYLTQLSHKNLEAAKQNTAIKIVAGETPENLQKMIPQLTEFDLQQYEWFIKVRSQQVIRYFSDDLLIDNEEFLIYPAEREALDTHLLNTYYYPLSGNY